jgi:hypothetical protein
MVAPKLRTSPGAGIGPMPLLAMASSAGPSELYWLWVAASFQTTPLPLAGKGLTP